MGLMTGAWEVPLPKPIPRQPLLHTGQYSPVHRMSPSMDGSAAPSPCCTSPALYLDVYVHAGADAGAGAGGYHGLATAQYVPCRCRCGWPLHLNRNLRRGLQLEAPRLALQQTLGGGCWWW